MHAIQLIGLFAVMSLTGGCLSERSIADRLQLQSRSTREKGRTDDAIGFVSISTPLFSPLDEAAGGDKRLDLLALRKESEIAEKLNTPAFSSQRLQYDMFRMAMALRISGVAVNMSQVSKSGSLAEGGVSETGRSDSRTFETPSDLPEVSAPELDPAMKALFLKMLDPTTSNGFKLPQDEIATLTASLKTYMVNLEEYYNVDGYNYAHGLSGQYVPYKMHFTVTAEPGWFSRYRKYDAVVQLTCTLNPQGADERDIIILNASPLENAQTVTEFDAAMAEFGAALDVQAPIGNSVLAGAKAERLQAVAQRLEGIRAHRTLAVGFPDSNTMRIRFLAQRAGIASGRDLQPVSRIMTATVLVPVKEPGYGVGVGDARQIELRLGGAAHSKIRGSGIGGSLDQYADIVWSEQVEQDAQAALGASLDRQIQRLLDEYKRSGVRMNSFVEEVFRQSGHALRSGRNMEDLLKPIAQALLPVARSVMLRAQLAARTDGNQSATTDWDSLQEIRSDEELLWLLGNASRPETHVDVSVNDANTFFALLQTEKPPAQEKETEAAFKIKVKEWLVKEGLVVLRDGLAMSKAFGSLRGSLAHKRSEAHEGLRQMRQDVGNLLKGTECDVTVKGYYAPTMFGRDGDIAPPRDYLVGVFPTPYRLCTSDGRDPCGKCSGCCQVYRPQRKAPIPPWLGPLDDPVKILCPKGYYALDLACVDGAEAASTAAASAEGKAKKALDDARKSDEKKAAAEELVFAIAEKAQTDAFLKDRKAAFETAKKLPAVVKATEVEQVAVDLARSALIREQYKPDPDPTKVLALKKNLRASELVLKTKFHAVLAHQWKQIGDADKDQKDAEKFLAMVKAHPVVASLLKLEEVLKKAKTAATNAKKEAKKVRPAALGRGRAVVSFTYQTPPLLLDGREKLIHNAAVYARVLGLERAAGCDEIPCSSDKPSCRSGGDKQCAPGEFCQLVPGRHDAVLAVNNIDLSFALAGDPNTSAAKGRPIRAIIQVVVVPHNIDVHAALRGSVARVCTHTVQLESRVLIGGGGATKPKAVTPAPKVELTLRDIEMDFIPKQAETK